MHYTYRLFSVFGRKARCRRPGQHIAVRWIGAITLLAAALIFLIGAGWKTQPRSDMPYLIRSAVDGRALEVAGASPDNLAPVQVAPASGGAHQSWYFVPERTPEGARYVIFSLKSGRVLDVRSYSQETGAPVQQFAYYGRDNQRWRLLPEGEAYFRLVAAHSGQCLGIARRDGGAIAAVGQYDCDGGPRQRWRLAPNPQARKVHVLVARHSGMALDIQHGGRTPADRNVIQAHRSGDASQLWTLIPAGGDAPIPRYTLISFATGGCLDVAGKDMNAGANVQQYPCNAGRNQQWRLAPIGDGAYRVFAAHSDLCLDVKAADTRAGANVQQYPCHDGDNQAWRLIATEARP